MKNTNILLILVLLAGCNKPSFQDVVLMDGINPTKTTASQSPVPNKQAVISVSPFPGIKSDTMVSLPESPLPSVSQSPLVQPTPTPQLAVLPEITSPPVSEDTSEPAPTPLPTPSPIPSCDPSMRINYEQVDPVPVDVKTGNVALYFWDKYKVRWDNTNKVFISQSGADVSKANKLIKDYNITVHILLGSLLTQEQADQEEKSAEARYCGDWPNWGSIYELRGENINIKEFIEKMRTDIIIRSCNYHLTA